MNLLDNTTNQPCKFRTKNWVEINDDSHWMYNTNTQINFRTSMLKKVNVVIVMHTCMLKKL